MINLNNKRKTPRKVPTHSPLLMLNLVDKKPEVEEEQNAEEAEEEEQIIVKGIDEFYPDGHIDKLIEDS